MGKYVHHNHRLLRWSLFLTQHHFFIGLYISSSRNSSIHSFSSVIDDFSVHSNTDPIIMHNFSKRPYWFWLHMIIFDAFRTFSKGLNTSCFYNSNNIKYWFVLSNLNQSICFWCVCVLSILKDILGKNRNCSIWSQLVHPPENVRSKLALVNPVY